VGILSITGFPLTNGFVSKTLIKSSLKYNIYYKYLLHLINLGTIISFIKVSTIFFGTNRNENIKEALDQNIAIGILGFVTLFSGIFEMYILKKYLSITLTVGVMDFVIYFIYVGFGYLFYKYFIKKEAKVFYQLRHYEMGFKDANVLLVVFTITTILFLV
jgi:multicomponent Na+:H+ antiporter subunit D